MFVCTCVFFNSRIPSAPFAFPQNKDFAIHVRVPPSEGLGSSFVDYSLKQGWKVLEKIQLLYGRECLFLGSVSAEIPTLGHGRL